MGRLACAAAAMVALVLSFCAVGSSCAAESDGERLPGELFRDCADCPELVIVPSGEFDMGSNAKTDRAASSPRQHPQELCRKPPRGDFCRVGPMRGPVRLQV